MTSWLVLRRNKALDSLPSFRYNDRRAWKGVRAIKENPVLKIKLVKKLKESSTVASGAVAFGATKPEPKVEEEDDKKR